MLSKLSYQVSIAALLFAFCCVSFAQTPSSNRGPTAAFATSYSANENAKPAKIMLSQVPLDFELNQGQADAGTRFVAHEPGYSVYLTNDSAYIAARNRNSREAEVVQLHLVNASPSSHPEGVEALAARSNYFLGSVKENWRTDVPHFSKVAYRNVYPGIDLLYYGNQKQLEHDFIVSPGADAAQIALTIKGSQGISLNPSGEVEIQVGSDKLILQKPLAYQGEGDAKKLVECTYELTRKHEVRFRLEKYDRSRTLVIDPVLMYSTFLGGNNNDQGTAIAVDSQGNAYVTGFTLSSDFPVQGAINGTCANSCHAFDVFVTKFNASGSALIYSTFLGGTNDDEAYGIAVDQNGNAYVTGYTSSINFPLKNAAQPALGGGFSDAFVFALNSSGSQLMYSTYLGGSGDEGFGTGNGFSEGSDNIPRTAAIAVDPSGNAYVVGNTDSTDFPVSNGAYQPKSGGSIDGYHAKYSPSGSKLFATYLGGSDDDVPRGVALDGATPPNIYITGNTRSANFPTTAGAYQTKCGTDGKCNFDPLFNTAFSDAFVTKFNASSALVYSTYLGAEGPIVAPASPWIPPAMPTSPAPPHPRIFR